MKRLRIGMISFAHSHAFSYYQELAAIENAEVVAIADENRERVQSLIEHGHLSYYEDYRNMLKLPEIDAVIVCSENVNHASMVMESARAGKHVLCEKPLGVGMDEMKIMIELCSKYGVQLMTAFPCRYLPAVMETKRALERGDIGQVVAVKGYIAEQHQWVGMWNPLNPAVEQSWIIRFMSLICFGGCLTVNR
ncbi:Gfo/Idh/MocA family oxidoreductase [Paenibacillus sp. UASWS1643]|uniref:Gfo/Idh/MocA family protein n=1 Tax=Paenibacillus sp. UASWS1643 TaxID=2580422 RepID=UPI00295B7B44|nr:Gfo/Idh/MocA family oxidoreductase [Paenibacillus sp. UASWS1643]